ncbi:hypothetical protein GCM10009559_01140 [Pseudonocardia zijingensis]|uniref:Uncharacterized protein n=1 Tax=Pseudonocardia zijingensis TaxID=153376 RepID=A0ABN1NYZ0_9PSEU
MLDVIQVENTCERPEDLGGGGLVASALEPHVVVDADAGEHGDLLAPQPGDPAALSGRDAGLFGRDERPPGAQVVTEPVALVHESHVNPERLVERGSPRTRARTRSSPNAPGPLRWAERDGTYAELLERRSQALRTLTVRAPGER